MNDMADLPRLVESHVIPLAENHGSFLKICSLGIHKTSGVVKVIFRWSILRGDGKLIQYKANCNINQ